LIGFFFVFFFLEGRGGVCGGVRALVVVCNGRVSRERIDGVIFLCVWGGVSITVLLAWERPRARARAAHKTRAAQSDAPLFFFLSLASTDIEKRKKTGVRAPFCILRSTFG
jgi:hypothetical protein